MRPGRVNMTAGCPLLTLFSIADIYRLPLTRAADCHSVTRAAVAARSRLSAAGDPGPAAGPYGRARRSHGPLVVVCGACVAAAFKLHSRGAPGPGRWVDIQVEPAHGVVLPRPGSLRALRTALQQCEFIPNPKAACRFKIQKQ